MSPFTGTRQLLRIEARRDRIVIPAWVAAFVVLTLLRVASVRQLHPDQASLDDFARTTRDSTVAAALNGIPNALDTLGGRVAFELLTNFTVALGLMSLFLVTRHTVTNERDGRTELLRSTMVGPYAPTAAALTLTAAANLAVAALAAVTYVAFGLPTHGSVVLALAPAMAGIVFASLAAVIGQLTTNPRVANATTGTLLGIAFAARALGDSQDLPWLSRLSPIGWAQATQPFGSNNWIPLLSGLTTAAAITGAALKLTERRDVGQALLPSRPGPAHGTTSLGTPLGLAIRTHRPATLGWLAGITAYGSVFGLAAVEIVDAAAGSPTLTDYVADGTGTLTENYLATVAVMLAVLTTGYIAQQILRLAEDETAGRADLLLTRPLTRTRWAFSHLAVTLAGSAIILAGSGLAVGLIHGLRVDRPRWAIDMAAAELAYLPAIWTIGAVAILLYALIPRIVAANWAILGVIATITLIGEPTRLPDWAISLSPFTHLPAIPAEGFDAATTLVLVALITLALATSRSGFERRDLRSS